MPTQASHTTVPCFFFFLYRFFVCGTFSLFFCQCPLPTTTAPPPPKKIKKNSSSKYCEFSGPAGFVFITYRNSDWKNETVKKCCEAPLLIKDHLSKNMNYISWQESVESIYSWPGLKYRKIDSICCYFTRDWPELCITPSKEEKTDASRCTYWYVYAYSGGTRVRDGVSRWKFGF